MYGNTFIMTTPKGWGVVVRNPLDGSVQSTIAVRNNIFCGGYTYGVVRPDSERMAVPLLESEKNLIFKSSKHIGADWTRDLVGVDPLLVNPVSFLGSDGKAFTADDGYLLRQGSPCIDAGAKLEDTAATKDILSTTRPQGFGWDIGAHEFAHDNNGPR